eukprot:TRINITY_DN7251_c0_g3_i2.p1 TRINITY_DN7251_c0_g3~~TRINITY_DN7251_c0_g3_i2.p1  ORF type:complete len:105 (+),score=6.51 TRINITY_DN7251_c0_g3_i2:2-316(+)
MGSNNARDRTTVLQELSGAYQVVTKEDLIPGIESKYPAHEMQAAFEQGVTKEAAVFLAPSNSAFSTFVYQIRCFTRPVLGNPLRATVLYDKGASIMPCRVRARG